MFVTPKDIENPKNLSGYNYVVRAGNRSGWQASRNGGGRPDGWRGQLRRSALEAAWDYCNHVNGLTIAPPQRLKSAGHPSAPRKAPTARQQRQAAAKVKRDLEGWVYLIGEQGDDRYLKIGESERHPQYRLRELQTGNPRKLVLLGFIKCNDRITTERNLHMKYIKQNHLQEWFKKDPAILQEFPQTQYLIGPIRGGSA